MEVGNLLQMLCSYAVCTAGDLLLWLPLKMLLESSAYAGHRAKYVLSGGLNKERSEVAISA